MYVCVRASTCLLNGCLCIGVLNCLVVWLVCNCVAISLVVCLRMGVRGCLLVCLVVNAIVCDDMPFAHGFLFG